MSSKLNTNILRRHFPHAGEGLNPRVETDTECLIIRRVLINGKPYDIRVWKYDAEDQLLKFNEDTFILKKTINAVQGIVKEMYETCAPSVPTDIKLFYSDVKKGEKQCFQQNLSISDPDKSCTDLLTNRKGEPEVHPIVDYLERIHNEFFHKIGSSDSSNVADMAIRLKVVPHEDASPKKGGESTPVPVEKKGAVVKSETVDLSTPSKQGPSVTTEKENLEKKQAEALSTGLADAAAKAPDEGFLKGISYQQLVEFARKPNSADPILEKAYQVYQEVLENPSSEGEDQERMRKWLEHHYLSVYNAFKKLKADWEQLDGKEKTKFRDFEEWRKHYAAIMLLGFVPAAGKSIDLLAQLLIKSVPPSEIGKPEKVTPSRSLTQTALAKTGTVFKGVGSALYTTGSAIAHPRATISTASSFLKNTTQSVRSRLGL